MAEVDIPKRVIMVLLCLVILVSFLGTLTVLQMYATAPRAVGTSDGRATVGIGILQPPKEAQPQRQSDDSSIVSVKINKYEG